MAILEPPPEPSHKKRSLLITIGVIVVAAVIAIYFTFRFYPEQKAAERFFNVLVAGDIAAAYKLWKPSASYRIQDFNADWGAYGYYGPVKSYKITRVHAPEGQSDNVVVEVDVSPFSPMPDPRDVEKSRRTRNVTIWVNSNDKSLSFPP